MSNRIVRIRQANFSTIDNTPVEDSTMTWKAKGIFWYMWAQSEDWQFYESEMVNHAKDGKDGLHSGIEELVEHGYLVKKQGRSEDGKFGNIDWLLSEKPLPKDFSPLPDFPSTDKPSTVKPLPGNPQLTNTNKTNTNKTKTNITSSTTAADAEIEQLADVQAHYQTNLRPRGGIPSAVNQWLADYTKELGPELVKFAITKGVNQTSNPGPNYIKAILDSWKKKGIATVEQAENEKKARTTSNRVNRKKEVANDGFGGFEEFL